MSAYRLCLVSPNGQVSRALELDCAHDLDAVESAHRHEGGMAMELWNHGRLVRRFAAVLKPAPRGPS